jgi:hypothetical protein
LLDKQTSDVAQLDRLSGVDILGGKLFVVGDYKGLAAAGNEFVPTWAMPHGTDPYNVFLRRIIHTERPARHQHEFHAEGVGQPPLAIESGTAVATLAGFSTPKPLS